MNLKEEGEEQSNQSNSKCCSIWRNWGIVVVAAAFFIMMCIKIPFAIFGIIYSRLLMGSGVSTLTVAWIYNTGQFFIDIGSLLAAPLCEVFGWRTVGFISGFIMAFSMALTASIDNPMMLFLTYSLLGGITSGLLFVICTVVVSVYFDKGRGVAVGLTYTGFSTGEFVAPGIIYYLHNNFGERAATVILGAIFLNVCAASMILHPVEWHRKRTQGTTILEADKSVNTSSIRETTIETKKNSSICMRLMKSIYESLKMLKSLRVLIISVSFMIMIVMYVNFQMLVPFSVKSRGHPIEVGLWCLTANGITNLITRLTVAGMTDILPISIKYYFMTGLISFAVSMLAFGLVKSFTGLILCMVLSGASFGACLPLVPLLIIEIVGIEQLPKVFGANGFTTALGFSVLGPLVGLLRDYLQNYELLFQLFSIPVFCVFCLWFLMPFAIRYDSKISQEKHLPKDFSDVKNEDLRMS